MPLIPLYDGGEVIHNHQGITEENKINNEESPNGIIHWDFPHFIRQ